MEVKDEVLKNHPGWSLALEIITVLRSHGFEAVLAGGCVRDALLARAPKDLDIATSAEPSKVEEFFPRTVAVGKAFGVVRVLGDNSEIEVASFRFDGKYCDGRRPETIQFSTAVEDALRRDFTINAMFYDPVSKKIFDYVKGQEDIDLRLIRCVGRPTLRFQEDHLRLLRAVRFAAELGFEIETDTWQALKELAALVQSVSRERIRDEMFKILKAENCGIGFSKLHESGLFMALDPELGKIYKKTPSLFRNPFAKATEVSRDGSIYQDNQIWARFFAAFGERCLNRDFLEGQMKLYKLSREAQRFIQKCLYYLNSLETIAAWNLGKKLVTFAEAEFQWAVTLATIDPAKASHGTWLSELKLAYQRRGLDQVFPPRLLRGEDLPSSIPLTERKNVLDLAFQQQIENSWTHREEVLAWLVKRGGG